MGVFLKLRWAFPRNFVGRSSLSLHSKTARHAELDSASTKLVTTDFKTSSQ